MHQTILVIPCYNEAARLDVNAFETFATQHPEIRFLFVDDGSTDRTLALLQSMHAKNPDQLIPHPLPRNVRKAEAVRNGLLEACSRRPQYTGFWDADLATPLDELVPLLTILETRPEIQMAFGSRVNLLGHQVRRKLFRHYIGRVFATGAAFLLGVPIYDTQCGAKVFRVSDAFIARLQEPFIGGWIFDVEIIAREIQARRRTSLPQAADVIFENPLMVWRDVHGSKIKLRDWFTVGINLFKIYFKYLWK